MIPVALILWQTVFMLLCVGVVVGGVKRAWVSRRDLDATAVCDVLILLGFAVVKGNFSAAWDFLFSFNFEALSWRGCA